jgi:hypothetical protein
VIKRHAVKSTAASTRAKIISPPGSRLSFCFAAAPGIFALFAALPQDRPVRGLSVLRPKPNTRIAAHG